MKHQMTYIRSLVTNVADACSKPPAGATPGRVHTLHVDGHWCTGLGGHAHVRPQSEPHKGACVSGAPDPTWRAHAPPPAPHPRTCCARAHASSPPIVRPRQPGAAELGHDTPPTVPLRLPWRAARRPSGHLVDCTACSDRLGVLAGEDGTQRTASEAAAVRHANRGGRTREGTQRRQRRRSRSRAAAQVCAACAAGLNPPLCCARLTGSAHHGQTARWELARSMRTAAKKSSVRGHVEQGGDGGQHSRGVESPQ
jgi:hypothetical protein